MSYTCQNGSLIPDRLRVSDMTLLKIATSARLASYIESQRGMVYLNQTDFTDVAAVVMSVEDASAGILSKLHDLGFAIPTFVAVTAQQTVSADYLPLIKGVITLGEANKAFYNAQVEAAASEYQKNLLPPFFSTLKKYVEMNNSTFACPGHQGANFSVSILPVASFLNFMVRPFSVQICATQTSNWVIY